jgi:H+-transporting ATPase
VFGNQALLYVLRERGHMWRSRPGNWVLASSAADVTIVSGLALSGVLMEPLPWRVLVAAFAAATGFALVLDQIKRPVLSAFGI